MAARVEEIAQRAGVAVSTVYQVLRTPDDPTYPLKTRQRIQSLAEKLCFVPNSTARALASGRCQTIGLTVHTWQDPHLEKAVAAATRQAAEHGHDLLITSTHPARAWWRILMEGKVDLLINLGAGDVPTEAIEPLLELKDRIVVVGPHSQPLSDPLKYWGSMVLWDDQAGGACVAEHLLNLGHCQLGVIGGQCGSPRAIGFVRRALESGCRPWVVISQERSDDQTVQHHLAPLVGDRLILADDAGSDDQSVVGASQFAKLLEVAPQTTGVLCRNDRIASGVLSRAQAMGVSVPASLSVVGYTDALGQEMVWPNLTTVQTPIVEAVRTVLDEYFASGLGRHTRTGELVLNTRLIQRDSTAPPREKDMLCPE